jgi:hypothetical protein
MEQTIGNWNKLIRIICIFIYRGLFMVEKANVEPIDPMEKERGGRKKPLVSCEKYDEEERKAFLEEQEKA